MNLLDSHDTARFLSVARGDVASLKLAMLTMFTYVGAPTIYYGDEIALEGRRDPDCRRAMIWNPGNVNLETFQYIKRLTALRKKFAALRRGTFTSLYTEGKTVAFARQFENETVIIAINAGHEPISLDLRLDKLVPNGSRLVKEWMKEETIVMGGFANNLRIPARDGCVWNVPSNPSS